MIDIPSKLFTAFNNIKYYDEPHRYYVGKQELISVTTLIHKFQEDFDEEFWSMYKENEFGVSQNEIKNAWRYINKIGVMKGSITHDYAEHLFSNKIFPYPKQEIEGIFGYDPIHEQYLKTKSHVDKFHKFSIGKLIPIKIEFIVYDLEYNIAGMVDLLFYNIKAKEFQIWDWKTNKDFDAEGRENLLGPLVNLKDNDMEIYSLQLATYKHIIEKNTGIKLGKSYLIWISHLQKDFKIIETLDREFYIKKMIEAYNN